MVCLGVTRAVIEMRQQGMDPRAMRAAIDAAHANVIDLATSTPYPPE